MGRVLGLMIAVHCDLGSHLTIRSRQNIQLIQSVNAIKVLSGHRKHMMERQIGFFF
jgi:hypothetical protein